LYNFWPCWQANRNVQVTSSYLKEDTIVRAEFNLYSTQDERPLWNGESDTVFSKDFEKLAKSYAKMLVDQQEGQGDLEKIDRMQKRLLSGFVSGISCAKPARRASKIDQKAARREEVRRGSLARARGMSQLLARQPTPQAP
jgi:hypothetical protein